MSKKPAEWPRLPYLEDISPNTISAGNESCGPYNSRSAMAALMALIPGQLSVLDTTFGKGNFWEDSGAVVGMDLDSSRAKDLRASFFQQPFCDNAFDLVVFDPPFQPAVHSLAEKTYSAMGKSDKDIKVLFQLGLGECRRIARLYVIVKCQGYIHNHRPLWMPLWAIDVMGEPYEWLIAYRSGKMISGRWKTIRSLRRNHSDYLLFRKDGVLIR